MEKEKEQSKLSEYISAFKQALVVFVILYLAFWPMGIDGSSMETAFSHNDRVIVCRLMTMFNFFDRGDIIILKADHNGEEKDIIKRVVGVPGDNIRIEGGLVYLNGEVMEEEYINNRETYGKVDITLQKGEYFVLGDNREISYDSRHFGVLNKEKIVGRVILKWFPINDIKTY